jgi:hypothetical protein
MNKFFKFLTVSTVLSLMPNPSGIQACWNGFLHEDYNFRCWLFPQELIPMQAITALNYAKVINAFEAYRTDTWSRFRFDTTFYTQNVVEWETAMAADPAIGASKKVVRKDIHKILYNIDPNVYFRQMKGDSLKQNTFIQAVKASKPMLDYLNYAKTCEQLINFNDPWDENDKKDKNVFKKHINIGNAIAQQKTTSPFIRERTAYQVLKLSHYMQDTTQVMNLYKQYFEKTGSKSWVMGSASYYDALAHQNPLVRNALLAYVFENSIEKRWSALQMFDSESFEKSLAITRNPQERARMLLMPLMTQQGRTLKDLQKNYQVEPRNHLLPLAIQREINKLENWIFTNRFTEYAQSSAPEREYVDISDPKYVPQDKINAQNLKSDLLYLDEVSAFVSKVATERKQPNPAYWSLAAAHLAFLKKDFVTTKRFLAEVQKEKSVSTSIQLQTALTELLCDLYATPRLNAEHEKSILKFDGFLQKNAKEIANYDEFRSQIMRFLSERFVADGQTAKGLLILSKSNLVFGAIKDIWEKNFYHKTLETKNPQIIEQIIDIAQRKNRTTLTDFERWLASEPKPYGDGIERGFYSSRAEFEAAKAKPVSWSINKLKDYESMIYIQRDDLDSAYLVLKTIPNDYWAGYPHSTYLIDNPFKYMTYVPRKESEENLPKARYTKMTFVKKLIDLKQQLKTDPKKFEQNYFLLGTAYYNMTHEGNFWLMSEIAWDNGYELERSAWNDVYFGGQRAADWFAKGVAQCTKKENAALCCFMANVCQNQRNKYDFELKYKNTDSEKRPEFKEKNTPLWATLKTRFKDAGAYEKREYWCQHLDALMTAIDK